MRLGGLWVSEWPGREQSAVVSTARQRTPMRFASPSFLTPPFETRDADCGWARVETPVALPGRKIPDMPRASQALPDPSVLDPVSNNWRVHCVVA
ncbi:hypothetical protein GCM10009764_77340 [Nocardia ninae]|uniref:Uncharacterized protein n=1 Tax=Nocardia ninae NBRC 108245 TaxID=1210091 RepID=A0A511MH45_9NOCA|nr:hypothetical protein NN4_44910 [Nocardia ninae NBRC 108245]